MSRRQQLLYLSTATYVCQQLFEVFLFLILLSCSFVFPSLKCLVRISLPGYYVNNNINNFSTLVINTKQVLLKPINTCKMAQYKVPIHFSIPLTILIDAKNPRHGYPCPEPLYSYTTLVTSTSKTLHPSYTTEGIQVLIVVNLSVPSYKLSPFDLLQVNQRITR